MGTTSSSSSHSYFNFVRSLSLRALIHAAHIHPPFASTPKVKGSFLVNQPIAKLVER
jgi:hypothetical protein